jgi:hypothetical protein
VSYTLTLALTLAACFTVQSLALHSVGGKTNKSESNYFSSIARIQTGIRNHPKIMLLGSSLTGRFPDRTTGFTGVSNLGCDGGNAVDTLRAIDQGLLPCAPVLVIEGNTLYRSTSGQMSETAKAIRAPWFRAGIMVPQLGATARPAAFAYSKLLARKIGRAEGPVGPMLGEGNVAAARSRNASLPACAESLVCEIDAIIQRQRSKGVRLLIVILPPGAAENSLNIQIPKALSAKSGVPLLDLTSDLPVGAVLYTDGVHMAPASAAAALRTILAALDSNG